MIGMWIVAILFFAACGFAVGRFFSLSAGKKKLKFAADSAETLLADAKSESENLKRERILEAKEEIFQARQRFESQSKERKLELQRWEQKLSSRDLNLDRKVDILKNKEESLNQKNQSIQAKEQFLLEKEQELTQLIQEENSRLEQISGLTSEEAKRIQMRNMLEKAREEAAQEVHEIREDAKRRATSESQDIVIQALQKCSLSHVVDSTVSVVKLPDDEMKGRIIGREGRNIRAFESITGIEVLIDDTPQTVVLSGFDPVRREVARQSLEKLIYDGRIHPGRIEEVVNKATQEVEEQVYEVGEQTLQDLGVHGIHHELVRMLGRQRFRMNLGQNLLQHSKEVATLAGEMAIQLGLDASLARRAGILHDIGKTAEKYGESAFYELGAEVAKKFGENEKIQNAIACQAPGLPDSEIKTPISVLVKIADGVSVSRPGAQKEMLENYFKRMHKLEEVAKSFAGVINSYAIQAGRELRVIVEHSIVKDSGAQVMADNIAAKLRDEMQFPGQIRVTVIREYRSVDYAK